MDAVEFIVAQARMCNERIEDILWCGTCELGDSEYCTKLCDNLISRAGAEDAVRIVEAWSEGHPAQTRQDVLSKFFPTSQFDSNGVLNVCPAYIDARKRDESMGRCEDMTSDCHDCRREYWLEVIE